MKILITGAKGLLGSNLALMYCKEYEIHATDKQKPNFEKCFNYELDITKKEDLKIIEEVKPDLVVHCAALVNLDFCEENKDLAKKINAEGTKNIAEACKKAGSYLIHISTDAVFDGEKGNYLEEDITNPLSVYAKTKLKAEENIKKVNEKFSILRTNIYGWNSQDKFSLAEWMLDKLEKNEKFPGFEDIYFSPLLVNNLGEVILEVYEKGYNGILNVVGSESCSKLDFAKKIARVFNLDKELIYPTNSDDVHFKAKRAKKITLNIDKAKNRLQTPLLNVEEGLKEFKKLRESGFVDELKKNNI